MQRTDLVFTDLATAELADHPADRYLAAHRAALRATSVVLGVRAPRHTGRRNAWQLVAEVAPELAEWAGFFLATQTKREAVEAGVRMVVTEREADDMLRDAQHFCAVVEAWCVRQAPRLAGARSENVGERARSAPRLAGARSENVGEARSS
ncbi:SAV_6107 family HEPN domain-containing protein [Mariniluteicoccus flavus]